MKWNNLIILCLLILIQIKCSSELVNYKVKCYKDYCDNWGECYVKNNTRNCVCMKQYYTGRNCHEIVNHCKDSRSFEPCSKNGTKACIPYFGARYCQCKVFYMGETCNIRARSNYRESSLVAVYFFLRPVIKKNYRLWVVYKEPFDSVKYIVKVEQNTYKCSKKNFKKSDLLREVLALPIVTGSIEQQYYCQINHTFKSIGEQHIKLQVLTPNGYGREVIRSEYLFDVQVQSHLDPVEITGEIPSLKHLRAKACKPRARANLDYCSPLDTPDGYRTIIRHGNYKFKIPRLIFPCTPDEDVTVQFYYHGPDKNDKIITKKLDSSVFLTKDYPFGKVWLFITEVGNKYGSANYTCYCGARYSGTPGILLKPGIYIETGNGSVDLSSDSSILDLPFELGTSNLIHNWTCHNCYNFRSQDTKKLTVDLNSEIGLQTTGTLYFTLTVQPTEKFLKDNGVWKEPFKSRDVTIVRKDVTNFGMKVEQKHEHIHHLLGTIELNSHLFDIDVTITDNLIGKKFCISIFTADRSYPEWPNDACKSSEFITQTAGDTNTLTHSFTFNDGRESPISKDARSFSYTVFLNYWSETSNNEYQTSSPGYSNYRVVQFLDINERKTFEANKTLFHHSLCNYTDFSITLMPDRGRINWIIYVQYFYEYTDSNAELIVEVGVNEYGNTTKVYIRYDHNHCSENFYVGCATTKVGFSQVSSHDSILSLGMTITVRDQPARQYSVSKYFLELDKIIRGHTGYFSFSMQFAMKYRDIYSLASIVFNVAGDFNYIKESNLFPLSSPDDDKYHELLNYIFDLKNLQLDLMEEGQTLFSVYNYLSGGINYPIKAQTVLTMAKGYAHLCKETERVFSVFIYDDAMSLIQHYYHREIYSENVRSVSRLLNTRQEIHYDQIYDDFPVEQISIPADSIMHEDYYSDAMLEMYKEPFYGVRNATNESLYALDRALFAMRNLLYVKPDVCEFSSYSDFEVFMIQVKVLYNCSYDKTTYPYPPPTGLSLTTATVNFSLINPVDKPDKEYLAYVLLTPNPFWWEETIGNKLDFIVAAFASGEDLNHKSQGFELDYNIPYAKRAWFDINAIRDINGDIVDENDAAIYKVMLKNPLQPMIIQIDLQNTLDEIQFAYKINKYPEVPEILNSSLVFSKWNTFFTLENITGPKKDSLFNLFLGFMPKSQRELTFKVALFSIECEEWNYTAQSWQKSCELEEMDVENHFMCVCNNSDKYLSIYTGLVESYIIKHRVIIEPVFEFLLDKKYIIPITATLTLLVYLLCLCLAFRYDYSTLYKRKAIYLYSNRSHEQYLYMIATVTGVKYDSGTSSHVGIVLYGDNVKSKRHILCGYNNNKPIMQNGSTDFFWMTTGRSLGELSGIYLWIDYAGVSPSWFCEKVYVVEKSTDTQWVFNVNDWFSLNHHGKYNFSINRFTSLTQEEVVNSYAVIQYDDLKRNHLWFSMFHADYCGCCPRFGKVIIAFGALFLVQFTLLPLYKDGEGVFDNFTFNFSHTVQYGMFVTLFALGYHCCCLILLWRSPLTSSRVPWRILALGIIFIGIMLSYLTIVKIGENIGTFFSVAWLSAFLLAFLIDVILIQNGLLLLRGFLWRCLLKREEFHKLDCKISTKMPTYVYRGDKKPTIKKKMFFEVDERLHRIFKVKERKILDYRLVIPNLILFVLLSVIVVALYKVVTVNYRYHNLRTMNAMVHGNYSKSMDLNAILTKDDIYRYIKTTFRQVVHWQKTSWMIDIHFKVMGVAQIRQTRFLNDTVAFDPVNCMNPKRYKLYNQCYRVSNNRPLDEADYLPKWLPNNTRINSSFEYTEIWKKRNQESFLYTHNNLSTALPIQGKFYEIPAGGYITTLGRDVMMMNQVVQLLQKHEWIDNKTRTIVIEFFVFAPDSYFFNNVKLVIERSYLGPFHAFAKIDTFYITFLDSIQRNKNMVNMICAIIVSAAYFIAIYFHHFFLKSVKGRFTSWIFIDLAAFSLMLVWTDIYVGFVKTVEDLLLAYSAYRNNEYHSIDLIYPLYEKLRLLSAFVAFLFVLRITSFVPLTNKLQKIIRDLFKVFMVLFLWMLIVFLVYASLFEHSLNFGTIKCNWWLDCFLVATASLFGKIAFLFPYNFRETKFMSSIFFWFWYPVLYIMLTVTTVVCIKMLCKLKDERAIYGEAIIRYTYCNYIAEYFGRREDFVTGLRKLPFRKNDKKQKYALFNDKRPDLLTINKKQIEDDQSEETEDKTPKPEIPQSEMTSDDITKKRLLLTMTATLESESPSKIWSSQSKRRHLIEKPLYLCSKRQSSHSKRRHSAEPIAESSSRISSSNNQYSTDRIVDSNSRRHKLHSKKSHLIEKTSNSSTRRRNFESQNEESSSRRYNSESRGRHSTKESISRKWCPIEKLSFRRKKSDSENLQSTDQITMTATLDPNTSWCNLIAKNQNTDKQTPELNPRINSSHSKRRHSTERTTVLTTKRHESHSKRHHSTKHMAGASSRTPDSDLDIQHLTTQIVDSSSRTQKLQIKRRHSIEITPESSFRRNNVESQPEKSSSRRQRSNSENRQSPNQVTMTATLDTSPNWRSLTENTRIADEPIQGLSLTESSSNSIEETEKQSYQRHSKKQRLSEQIAESSSGKRKLDSQNLNLTEKIAYSSSRRHRLHLKKRYSVEKTQDLGTKKQDLESQQPRSTKESTSKKNCLELEERQLIEKLNPRKRKLSLEKDQSTDQTSNTNSKKHRSHLERRNLSVITPDLNTKVHSLEQEKRRSAKDSSSKGRSLEAENRRLIEKPPDSSSRKHRPDLKKRLSTEKTPGSSARRYNLESQNEESGSRRRSLESEKKHLMKDSSSKKHSSTYPDRETTAKTGETSSRRRNSDSEKQRSPEEKAESKSRRRSSEPENDHKQSK